MVETQKFVAPEPIVGEIRDHYLRRLAAAFTAWVNICPRRHYILAKDLVAAAAANGETISISIGPGPADFAAVRIPAPDIAPRGDGG